MNLLLNVNIFIIYLVKSINYYYLNRPCSYKISSKYFKVTKNVNFLNKKIKYHSEMGFLLRNTL